MPDRIDMSGIEALLAANQAVQRRAIDELASYHLRKHHRQGLRSLILEVLAPEDVLKETRGELVDGRRLFPRAVPRYMLRIFRHRFTSIGQVRREVSKYAMLLEYLGPNLIARSEEFIVEYAEAEKKEIVLCGLQEYVQGVILDPWRLIEPKPLDTFYRTNFSAEAPEENRVTKAREAIETFVRQTREMILCKGYIPDLAGNGNLILTDEGGFKLVDINNIIRIDRDDTIRLDDKNYPSCDKSMEVLTLFEEKILETVDLAADPLYGHFLSEERIKRVKKLEHEFYKNLNASTAGPGGSGSSGVD